MAWLEINGISFGVEAESTDQTDDSLRTQGRSVNGQAFSSVVDGKRAWTFTVPVSGLEEQRALERYLRGADNGHVWDAEGSTEAESFFSSKGLEIVGTTDFSQSTDSKFGTHSYNLAGDEIVVDPLPDQWTVAAWHTTDTWSTDSHYLRTSNDDTWVDGTQNNSATVPWDDPQNSSFDFWGLNGTGADERYDDLLFFPFAWPDRWPTEFDLTTAHSKLPELTLSGDFYDRTPTDVLLQDQPTVGYIATANGDQAAVEFSVREV